VGEAGDGDETIQKVIDLRPDVLVLDVSMPGKNGIKVIRELAAMDIPVHVLVLSAYDDEEFITRMVDAGAVGYLLKREALDTIVEAVRGTAAGERGWFSRTIINKIVAAQRLSRKLALTQREKEILHYLALGWSNVMIGNELGISERTVRYHLRHIYEKIGVDSRGMAIAWAIRQGFDKEM